MIFKLSSFHKRNVLSASRPTVHIVFLADKRRWAFDFVARSIARRLSPKWRCTVAYSDELPVLDPHKIDFLYLFFWGERYEGLGFTKNQVIKEVASYRWMTEDCFGRLSPCEFVDRYLDDAHIVTTPCAALCNLLSPLRKDVYHCPNGIEPSLFNATKRKRGEFTLIWAGNALDPGKGFQDIIMPAIGSDYRLIVADGKYSRLEIRNLYRSADVILIASGIGDRNDISLESQPLPLIEAMACGCFPVATNVGIVPEIVENGFNGLIIPKRTPKDLRCAVDWCAKNLDYIRSMGDWNAVYINRYRSWDHLVSRFDDIFSFALNRRHIGEETKRPDVLALHAFPSQAFQHEPANSHSRFKYVLDLVPLAANDLWNSLTLVRSFSRAVSIFRRKAALCGIFKTLSKMFCKAIRRDRPGNCETGLK